jgi:hypothetical protein
MMPKTTETIENIIPLVLRKQNLITFNPRKSIHANFKDGIESGTIFQDPTYF